MAPVAVSLIALMASSFMQPVISSVINAITRKGVRIAEKGKERGIFPLVALLLTIKALSGKWFTRVRKRYNNLDHMDQNFFFLFHPLSNIEITKNLSYEPRFNVVFSRDNLPRIKDGVHIKNLHDKKVKENISFHYLLTKT